METLFEYRKVEYPYDGVASIAAGTLWKPTAKQSRVADDATLEEDEVGEVIGVEIYNPDGADIKAVYFVPDRITPGLQSVVYASGIWDTLMFPPHQLIRWKQPVSFGKPTSKNLLQSTTFKYQSTFLPVALAGAAGITDAFTVVIHSYIYKKTALARIFGTLDGRVEVVDSLRDRSVVLTKPELAGKPVSGDIWDKLPGGKSQSVPKIWPFVRFAANEKATVANRDYTFCYDDGEVEASENNLWFQTKDNVIAIIEGLGIRPHADSHFTGFKVGGDYMPGVQAYTKPTHNQLIFGTVDPILPAAAYPEFFAIPRLPDKVVVFATTAKEVPAAYREEGGVIHQTTAAVAADNIVVAAYGKLIELVGA